MLKKVNTLFAFLFLACALTTHTAHQRTGIVKSLHIDNHSPAKSAIEEPTCCGLSYTNAKRLACASCPVGALITACCLTQYLEGTPAFNGESAWQIFQIPVEFYALTSNPPEKEFICAKTLACIFSCCPHCALLAGGFSTYACIDSCVDKCFKGPKIAKMDD